MAEKYKIKNFIHAGDFWNQDMFSRFDVSREDLIPWNEEIKVGKGIIQSLKSVFKNVYFFLGSHDLRVWLMLLRQGKDQPFDMAWRMTEEKGINVSQYRYAEIGTEWRINHPKNVVKVGGLPSVRLSAKHNRSIIFGHGHWWGINRDPSGKHYLVAPGCLVDKERISYRSLWDTSHDEWVNGFCMIVDKNKPILFSSDSPWKMYLK